MRHGHEDGEVTLGARRVSVRRPRARSADGREEIALATYAHFADRDPLTRVVLEQMLAALMARRLDDVRLAAMMIDGIDLKGGTNVVALGITTDGVKIPLGLWEGSTENATLATALLSDLVARGLDAEQGVLFVIDGAKALRKATRDVFGCAPVQRCARHKECHEAATSGAAITLGDVVVFERSRDEQFVGLDWATRRAWWCAVAPAGAVIDEGWIAADEQGLAMLVARLGPEALACVR